MSRDGQLPTKEGKANIDGNPLYFAQATSDGIPRTDGSGDVKDRGPVTNFIQSLFNNPNGSNDLGQQPSQHLIDRPLLESLTPKQYESYRKKVEEFDAKLKKSDTQILKDPKINNLLIAEQLTLKSLIENRKKLVDDFKRKILEDIKNSPSDKAYKESPTMVKARAEFEKAIGEIDKNTKNLIKKADKVIQKPTNEKDIVREAKNPVNYEKHMGLSREQAIERNNQINKENKLKANADIELQKNIKNVESLKKEVSDLENKLAKEKKLDETKIIELELQEKKPLLEKAIRDYESSSSKQADIYKESLARKNKESADLLKTFYGNLIYANQPIIDKLNEKIDAATDEATKKELEKDRETEQKKQNKLKAVRDKAISDIVNKYTSSKIIAIDTDHDKLPDKDAKFHDPKLLVKKYTESNLNYIRDMEKGLYKPNENYPADPVNGEQNIRNTAPEFEIKEIPDNSGRQQLLLKDNKGNDIGVINLGTEKADQKGDYGEKVIVTSDRIEDLKAGKWDPELGKVVYTQSGANTCQSYTLLAQMIQEGVKFRDNTEDGRKLIHELTRLQLQIGETGNMSTATLNAYNNILAKYGLKANDFTEKKGFETIEQRHNAIKEQLRKGKIVNSGMYLDAPEFSKGGKYALDEEGNDIHKFDKGHRVNIVGYDDVRKEWIVNDSNKKEELTRYPYNDFELGYRWSTVLEKK